MAVDTGYCHHHIRVLGRDEPGPERRALAHVSRVPDHLSACQPRHLCGPIRAPVVDDYDPIHVHPGQEHNAAYRRLLIERREYGDHRAPLSSLTREAAIGARATLTS